MIFKTKKDIFDKIEELRKEREKEGIVRPNKEEEEYFDILTFYETGIPTSQQKKFYDAKGISVNSLLFFDKKIHIKDHQLWKFYNIASKEITIRNILDLGCGPYTGYAVRFARYFPNIKVVLGDLSKSYIKKISERIKKFSNVSAEVIDITRGLKRKYDFIICLQMLEHIKDDKTAIKNMYEAINSKGFVWIQVPPGPGNEMIDSPGGYYHCRKGYTLKYLKEITSKYFKIIKTEMSLGFDILGQKK